jgi:sulfur-oxidizing protein SoxA
LMMDTLLKWSVLIGLLAVGEMACAGLPDDGLRIMANRAQGNCIACHDIPAWRSSADAASRLTLQGTLGPSLQGVADRYSQEQLRQWVADARVMRPDTRMPPYGTTEGLHEAAREQSLLNPLQIEAVVAALARFTNMATDQAGAASASSPSAPAVASSVEQLRLADDMTPVVFWVEQGRQTWSRDCVSCHTLGDVAKQIPQFPRLSARRQLINLEDQIAVCRQRGGAWPQRVTAASGEDPVTLGLSAFLHDAARGRTVHMAAPSSHPEAARWQQHLADGERLYNTRFGHMNLACRHCHDEKVGATMRAFRITPGHPVGFPAYRISWQGMGSMDRRIRACFSGVQARVPAPGDERLRQLELYLKYRAQGVALEGPSVKP